LERAFAKNRKKKLAQRRKGATFTSISAPFLLPSAFVSFPNQDQLAVIEAVKESLLVLAPMGTGKTRTAAAAIRKAIESNILPEKILGLTFTNRAAEAMRKAVADALPQISHRINLFNLHGLCVQLLREEGSHAHLPPDFGILDEDESKELLWQYIPKSEQMEIFKNKPQEALNSYEKFVFDFLINEPQGPIPAPFKMYRDALRRDGNVDFTGIIARTYWLLKTHTEIRDRWQSRYDWILVDEVQDINLAEYSIIALLGAKSRCLKFFGDHHQTIYEWRFAQPRAVIETFEKNFKPRRLALRSNYRCADILVRATNALRERFIPSKEPLPEAAANHSEGSSMSLQHYDASRDEVQAVVTQINTWKRDGIPYHEMAILARQNQTLIEISTALKTAEIPHLVAEDFDFFRRQEVKDVLSVLQHLVSPFRRNPILRLLKRFGAAAGALDAFEKEAQGTGLHLGYLIRGASGDPLHPLIQAWDQKQVIALDTETSGLDPFEAEILQIARVAQDAHQSFNCWIRPSKPVGESVHIHGFTDEFLDKNGGDAKEVLQMALQFPPSPILLGHNLNFDIRLIKAVAGRLVLDIRIPSYFDTMPLAANCLTKEQIKGLRLELVAQSLNIPTTKAHDAEADSKMCLDILEKLMPQLKEAQTTRMKLIAGMGSELGLAFRKVTSVFKQASEFENETASVSELIRKAWDLLKSTPGQHDYATNSIRAKNIEDLIAIAKFLEERRKGKLSLSMFTEQVALSRRDMLLEVDPHRVRLLSAHAAKGLEFDAVLLPRLIAPWSGYTEEEARVFYVMLTRARRQVWMSYPKQIRTTWGQEQPAQPLQYLSAIQEFVNKAPTGN
jgi:DNA helicase II / ATP-dependent DNA helicase PcrA